MKVYLSVPIIANRSLARAKLMAEAISDSGHELTSPWVLKEPETKAASVLNIFSRDKAAVESSDAILADVSAPSLGVGMEVMIAYSAGKRVILAAAEGVRVTRMLTDMDGAEWLRFTGDKSMRRGLLGALGRGALTSTSSRT